MFGLLCKRWKSNNSVSFENTILLNWLITTLPEYTSLLLRSVRVNSDKNLLLRFSDIVNHDLAMHLQSNHFSVYLSRIHSSLFGYRSAISCSYSYFHLFVGNAIRLKPMSDPWATKITHAQVLALTAHIACIPFITLDPTLAIMMAVSEKQWKEVFH